MAPDESHGPAPSRVLHDLRRQALLPLGLAGGPVAQGDLEGAGREEPVDTAPEERLDARPDLATLPGRTQGGLTEAPQRVAGQPDGQDPQDDVPEGAPVELLERPPLIGLLGGVTGRDQDGEEPDQEIDQRPRRQTQPGRPVQRLVPHFPGPRHLHPWRCEPRG